MLQLKSLLKNKKFLIIAGLILALIVIFIVFEKSRQVKTASSLPPVDIPKITSEKIPVEITFSKKDFNFPDKISVLEKQPAILSDQEVAAIAQKLGFTSGPQKAKDALEGDMIIYSSEKAYLIATLAKGKIEYQLTSRPLVLNKGFSDSQLIKNATDFLSQNNLVTEGSIKFSSFAFLKTGGPQGFTITNKNDSSFYQLNFAPQVSSLEVITLNPINSPIAVRLLPDGRVYGATVFRFGSVKESSDKFKVKSFESVSSSINANGATLINLDQGNLSPTDLVSGAISKVTLNEIKMAYLESGDSSLLQPVFILNGVAQITGLSKEVAATFYLPAVASN